MFDDLTRTFDGLVMFQEATRRLEIHLSALVAQTALWAHPRVHAILVEENGLGAWFPTCRRCRSGQGEKVGQVMDGIRLDDNTYANAAIKRAMRGGDCRRSSVHIDEPASRQHIDCSLRGDERG